MSRLLRWLMSSAGFLLLVCIGVYGYLVHDLSRKGPIELVTCAGERSPLAWTCGRVLRHFALDEEDVRRLNAEAGAQYAVFVEDADKAEELLELLLSRGVDINARHHQSQGWTALHLAAMDGRIANARLLVEHGARLDAADADGRTPLEIARRMEARYPDDPGAARMVQYLESLDASAP